jgi:3-oxoacyl-[acyl-carrier protein] reductase
MNLENARALVTGGSSGIGHGIARALRDRGAAVAICGRGEARLDAAARELGVLGVQADVGREADVERMMGEVTGTLGGLDVLVNNAGIGSFAPLVETTADDFRRVWEVNVLGAMLCARAAARLFIAQGRGHIVNIASTAGLRAGAGGTSYASTKFALRGLSESWRAELRPHNVRVMLVNPSEVVTEFFGRAGRRQADDPSKLHPEEIAHAVIAVLEMPDRGFVPELSVWATNPSG